MKLSEIKEQERAVRELKVFVKNAKIPHAMIFYGIPGIGKHSSALALASLLNCDNSDPQCSGCPSCKKIDAGNHPDLISLAPLPGKKAISIDQVRELILKMRFAPVNGRYKVAIIDQAEKLNKHSSNALLKTLEEPPPDIVIILVTSNIRTIQPTILSRCNLIKFSPLSDNFVKDHIADMEEGGDKEIIARLAEGSIGKAVQIASSNYEKIRDALIELILKKDKGRDALDISEHITGSFKDNMEIVFDMMLLLQRDLITLKRGLPPQRLFNRAIEEDLKKVAGRISLRELFNDSDLIYLTRNSIFHNNANTKIAMDNLMINLSYGNN